MIDRRVGCGIVVVCFFASTLISAVLLWGAGKVVAFLLTALGSVVVTVGLAKLAETERDALRAERAALWRAIEVWQREAQSAQAEVERLKKDIVAVLAAASKQIEKTEKAQAELGRAAEAEAERDALRGEAERLRAEVGKLHRLLQRADALLDPDDPAQAPVWTETNEILSRCSDANERAEKAEAALLEIRDRRCSPGEVSAVWMRMRAASTLADGDYVQT